MSEREWTAEEMEWMAATVIAHIDHDWGCLTQDDIRRIDAMLRQAARDRRVVERLAPAYTTADGAVVLPGDPIYMMPSITVDDEDSDGSWYVADWDEPEKIEAPKVAGFPHGYEDVEYVSECYSSADKAGAAAKVEAERRNKIEQAEAAT